jgi:hypothetical protein
MVGFILGPKRTLLLTIACHFAKLGFASRRRVSAIPEGDAKAKDVVLQVLQYYTIIKYIIIFGSHKGKE